MGKLEFNTTEELIEDIRNGKMVILVDDEDRENEGDIVLAADFVNPILINFMVSEAKGLVCLSLTGEQIERLQLPQMVRDELNHSPNKTAFTVSIEAFHGVSTGISAQDRSHTIKVASNPRAIASDVITPGHIFPIRAQIGGVLKRAGHTEGSVDLARIAGLNPAAVICEVMKEDGSMARVPDLFKFAHKHNLKIGTIVDLIEYRLQRELLVEEIYSADVHGYHSFKARVFKSKLDQSEHLVLQRGEINSHEPVMVRIQSDVFSRDLLGLVNSGKSPIQLAMQKISQAKNGLIVLLRGSGKSVGIKEEIESLLGVKPGFTMDNRDYGIGAQILRTLGVRQMILLTNPSEKKSTEKKINNAQNEINANLEAELAQKNKKKIGLKAFDLEVIETISL